MNQNTEVCGIDSKKFKRTGSLGGTFTALLGGSVTIPHYSIFKKRYDEVLDDLFKKYGKQRRRRVYSNALISHLFDDITQAWRFMDEFIIQLEPLISQFDIYYTYFLKDRPTTIKCYGMKKTPVQEFTPIEFIEKILINSYPHLCAWEHFTNNPRFSGFYFIDHFQADITYAWQQIATNSKLNGFLGGDESNPAISVADIFATVVDNRLYAERKRLRQEDIGSVFPEIKNKKLKVCLMADACLRQMVPLEHRKIPLKLKHPILFVLREESIFLKKEFLAETRLMDTVHNLAYEVDGAINYFDAKRHGKLVKDGDYFIWIGPQGEAATKIFSNLGLKVKILGPDDLKKYAID